jgi:hypothetical protein
MIEVTVWVMRVADVAVGAPAETARADPVGAPLAGAPLPTGLPGAVAGSVVVGAHGSGIAVGTVVGGSDGEAGGEVPIEVVEIDGVVSGVGIVVVLSAGTVGGVGSVGAAATVVPEQSAAGAAAGASSSGAEKAAVLGEETCGCGVAVDAAGVELELELVWPGMRWSTVNVDDNWTEPSTVSVVVRSPTLTVAVLKVDATVLTASACGFRADLTAAVPARARQMASAMMTIRRR